MALPGSMIPDPEEERRRLGLPPLTPDPVAMPQPGLAPLEAGGGGAPAGPSLVPTATPGFPLAPGQLPEKSVTTVDTQRSRTEFSPETEENIEATKGLIGERKEAIKQQVEGREKQLTADKGLNDIRRQEADARAIAEEDMQRRRNEAIRVQNENIARATAESERRVAEMEKAAKPTTYWEDKGIAAELLSHIIVGLSDRSHRMAGGQGPSPMEQRLTAALAEDKARKLAAFDNSKEFVRLAKENVAAAQQARANKLLEIGEQHKVNVEVLGKQYAALAAQQANPLAEAQSQQEIAILKGGVNKDLAALRSQVGSMLAPGDTRVTDPTRTVTRNFTSAPGGELPKPEQGVLKKDGKGYHEMPTMPAGRMENINKQLQGAGQITDAIREFKEASIRAHREGKPFDEDAAERLGRVVAANKMIEAKDESGREINIKGIVRLPIPFSGASKRDELIKQVTAPGFLKRLENDIRESAISELNTAGVPRAQAQPAVDDFAPAPAPPGKNAATTALVAAHISGGDVDKAVSDAKAAGVSEEAIKRILGTKLRDRSGLLDKIERATR